MKPRAEGQTDARPPRGFLRSGARAARRALVAAVPIAHPAVARHPQPISLDELLLALAAIAMLAIALAAFWHYPRFKRRRELRKRIRVVYEARRIERSTRNRVARAEEKSPIRPSGESRES